MKNKRTFRKRWLFVLGLLCLCGVLAITGINLWVIQGTKDRVYDLDDVPLLTGYDCILVLGAGVKPDGSPSDMLYDRVSTALTLYHDHADTPTVLLMSGDNSGPDYNEVGCMQSLALADGVPEHDVWLDHEGFSTSESLNRAKTEFGVQKVVIVTQGYHLYRALYIANRLGLDAIGVSADLRPYRGQLWRDAREAAARVKDVLVQ